MADNPLKKRLQIIPKSNVEQAYERQVGLKANPNYKQKVYKDFLNISNLFLKMFPDVSIEPPRGRIKSNRSLKAKIEDLEIERLCILNAVEGITDSEIKYLYQALVKQMENNDTKSVKDIMFGKIENLETIKRLINDENVPEKAKTALLRITKTRLTREPVENKEKLLEELEKIKIMVEKIGNKEISYDLLKWKYIEELEPGKPGAEEKMKRLHNPMDYLTVKDLIGIKIIVASVPTSFISQNPEMQKLLDENKQLEETIKARREARKEGELSIEDKKQYEMLLERRAENEDSCILKITELFANELMTNEDNLEKWNLRIDSYKKKEKLNGYKAEHIKFAYYDEQEKQDYTFELQLRSTYREELSRANGPAAHDQRSGKKRIFPNLGTRVDFVREARDRLPRYFLLKKEGKEYKDVHECTLAENMLEYYLGYVHLDPKDYDRMMKYVTDEEGRNREAM